MSEEGKKETLSLAGQPRRPELRKAGETGQVKQSFSHGRSKTVQVEVRKKRVLGRHEMPTPAETKPVAAPPAPLAPRPQPVAEAKPPVEPADAGARGAAVSGRVRHVLPTLSEAEKQARARALEDALRADGEARKRAEAEARKRVEEEGRLAAEREAAEKRRLDEDARRKVDEESRRKAEEDAARRLQEQEDKQRKHDEPASADGAAAQPATPAQRVRPTIDEEEAARLRRAAIAKVKVPVVRRADERRRGAKITVTQALSVEDKDERTRSLASVRRERERERRRLMQMAEGPTKVLRDVTIPETITVQELANRMAERAADVIRKLMAMGVMATINQTIDTDTAELIVAEFGHRAKRVSAADVEIGLRGAVDDSGDRQPRPPVVTVMGHVDHGKTSLLDAIRQSDVAAGEAGGITQHIGAYQVETAAGRITFIDTPGHEAFTAMRARGAKVTDIVVLVVAADDGVMPQTVEAINHARAAGVPIVVAVNKIDKPGANPMRVQQELLQHQVVPESLGGEVQVVEVSALKKTNIDKLLDALLLQAEVLELQANPDRAAEGVVVEAKLDRGRGSVATVLVQRGTVRPGDAFVVGREWGRVRALLDSAGNNLQEAGPSTPVEILGLQGTPQAGDDFTVVEDEARAREVTDYRQRLERERRATLGTRGSMEQMFTRIKSGELKELPIVVKSDVQGSLEAIIGAAEKLNTAEVAVRMLHGAVGAITESDVQLARASGGLIIGFNVRANAPAREAAKRDGVDIRYYSIIYELVDDLKALMSGLLAPKIKETVIGNVEILQVFTITKAGKIAGCKVSSGLVRRNARVRLLRDGVVVHDGALRSLKRFKDDVREVREGNECGLALENYQDIQVGDQLEVYETEEVQRAL
ncbi:MAG: translation initiation factor IF-2 [Alphaproteobacteria bacterium]|nr:translation initiation factor IF-2 [Alphaproteobacteria bacterium]